MYITSDLFDPASHYTTATTASPPPLHDWYNMVDAQRTAGLGKRKRFSEDDNATHTHGSSTSKQPSPHSVKRSHTFPVHAPNLVSATPVSCEQRPMKQLKRFSPKKPNLAKSTSHLMDIVSDPTSTPDTTTVVNSDVRPCHVCHKAPTRKRDLENYLECKSCDKRACYICARECAGGCQRPLCSKCCVEVGSDGDTWCLDCYHRNGNCI